MNAFVEHFIGAEPNVPHLSPREMRLAKILVITSGDVPGEVRKREQMGFVQVGSSDDHADDSETPPALATCCRHAAALGASLVVLPPLTAPQRGVYLAPSSIEARQGAEQTPPYGTVPVEVPDAPCVPAAQPGPLQYTAARVRLSMADDLEQAVGGWESKGFVRLGASDVSAKSESRFPQRLGQAAVTVGASLVLFRITPAKLRAVRRDADGRIDMDAVRADPPASLSPRGYYVTQAVFLAPTSIQARELTENTNEPGVIDVPIPLED